LVNKLTDKVFLVTGTSSGIGVETVRALHATGADIFRHVRDMEKGESVKKDILATSAGKGKLELSPWIWGPSSLSEKARQSL
jgi:NADP-dependent 3-hydroxy acid dehydrogenase YdfG